MADSFSRYLLGCRSQLSTATIPTKKNFERVFRAYGLPEAIRTDNGTPFSAATAISRLSKLSVWWIRLGIRPELIQPYHTEQNEARTLTGLRMKSLESRYPTGSHCAKKASRSAQYAGAWTLPLRRAAKMNAGRLSAAIRLGKVTW